MAQLSFKSIPTKSLISALIFGGGIFLFILLFILPSTKESKALDHHILDLNTRIKEQKILNPVYESLLKQSEMDPPKGLKVVEPQKLKRNETDSIAKVLQDMSRQNKLQLVDYNPEIQSLIGEADMMKVNVLLKGEFINLQPFLRQLCQMPYLAKIEEITIESDRNTKEMRLRLWLGRE